MKLNEITNPINTNNITNVEVDGIDTKDYPDFTDAYISYAEWRDTGTPLTDTELDILNSQYGEFVHQSVMDKLF